MRNDYLTADAKKHNLAFLHSGQLRHPENSETDEPRTIERHSAHIELFEVSLYLRRYAIDIVVVAES